MPPETQSQVRLRESTDRLFEEVIRKLDKVDARFDRLDDRIDERFDHVASDIQGVDRRLTRIEASDVAARVSSLETSVNKQANRLTKIETLFLPVTAVGGAILGAFSTWAFNFLPHSS